MKEHLNRIRQLLNELEERMPASAISEVDWDFSALDLPLIIQEIVDDLQPLLTPYEAAFYWYMFRHPIAENGIPLVRVSTTELSTSVVKSIHTKADRKAKLSLTKVRHWLAALESVGAIRRKGEANKNGTPYRVLAPDEIEACRRFRTERMKTSARPELSEKDLDYYNVRENRIKVFERDGYKCRYCKSS